MSLSKYNGMIIGQALGDAVGLPVEGSIHDYTKIYVQDFLQNDNFPRRRGSPHGQYTDDTQLARELILSFLDKKKFDAEHYASRMLSLFEANKIVGIGFATRDALMRLYDGVPWYLSGTPHPSAGNGTAMRAAPVALFYHDTKDIIKTAVEQGFITHQDKRCSAGSIVIALSTYYALHDEVDPAVVFESIRDAISPHSQLFADELMNLLDIIDLPRDDALDIISRIGRRPGNTTWDRISPYVIPSVLWSLYSFYSSPDNYWDTIITAVYCGGDVDTTAAMAGAISGAYNGLKGIPEKHAKVVNDNSKWTYYDLIDITTELYSLVHK